MDHVRLICDVGELTGALTASDSIEGFLQRTVDMVARHMHADVCSIYLYEKQSRSLVLRATRGLNRSLVGAVKLGLGEGIAGRSLEQMRPISTGQRSTPPAYRFFAGLREEQYDAFLAAPLLRGIRRLGVIVLQRVAGAPFDDTDTNAMQAVANQLAATVDLARTLIRTDGRRVPGGDESEDGYRGLCRGRVASVGFGHGPAVKWERRHDLQSYAAMAGARECTVDDLRGAIDRTAAQLQQLQRDVEQRLTDVASLVFAAHLLILKDEHYTARMLALAAGGTHPAEAVVRITREHIDAFAGAASRLAREKVDDITDLAIRILANLVDDTPSGIGDEGGIVIARSLLPSDMLVLAAEHVAGIVLVAGGIASHLSILARSLGIPVVIVDEPRVLRVADRTPVLLDAEVGNVYIEPTDEIVATFAAREDGRRRSRGLETPPPGPAVTADGTRVHLLANINLLTDVVAANELHADGIGLYRTEFPFIIRSTFPTEEEQYEVYRSLVTANGSRELTVRTLDVGGDKVLAYYDGFNEENPFLGMRSIRFSLQNGMVFAEQLRAIVRAGAGARLRIMFPMIGSLEELTAARAVLQKCIDELKRRGIEHNARPAVGMMVELPSAVELIDEFAAAADFFSIGTNDLVQYMLAVDRTNEKVASLYVQHHPAVLRVVQRVAAAGARAGIPVSVCGDMAHRPEYIPFLLGIGIRTLSAEPAYLAGVRDAVAAVRVGEAVDVAAAALRCRTAAEVARLFGIDQEG